MDDDHVNDVIARAMEAGPVIYAPPRRGKSTLPAMLREKAAAEELAHLERDGEGHLVVRCGECDDKAPERCGTCIDNAESASSCRLGISHLVHPEAWGDNLTTNLERLDG